MKIPLKKHFKKKNHHPKEENNHSIEHEHRKHLEQDHSKHEEYTEHLKQNHTEHEEHVEHEHKEHLEHDEHTEHNHHQAMMADFKKRFIVSLIITVPVFSYQRWCRNYLVCIFSVSRVIYTSCFSYHPCILLWGLPLLHRPGK